MNPNHIIFGLLYILAMLLALKLRKLEERIEALEEKRLTNNKERK